METEPSKDIVIFNNAVVCQLWEDAVSRQDKSTKRNFHSLPKIRDCKELWTEIESRESQFLLYRHNHSRSDRFRSGVRDFLEPIERVGKVASLAASNAFPPTIAIFGAVTVIVEAANVVSDGYDKISSCFEFVKNYFEQLEILKDNVTLTRSHLNAILGIFIHIVNFLIKAAYCIRRSRIHLFIKGLFTGEDVDLQKLKETFESKFEHEDRIIRNETRCVVQKIDKGVEAIHEKMKRYEENIIAQNESEERERLKKLLTWLSELDFASKHRLMLKNCQAGTGDWLLTHGKFQSWYSGTEMAMLWCSGKPGAGKSVMTSMVINHIREKARDEAALGKKVAVAYFYCDSKDPKTHLVDELLPVIIKVLIRKNVTVPEELDKLHQKYLDTEKAPSETDLLKLIESFSMSFDKVYVLIDALDEIPTEQRKKFIGLMKKLIELKPRLRLFVTSRPFLGLKSQFDTLHTIKIDKFNGPDIRSYLRSVLKNDEDMIRFMKEDQELEETILHVVSEKARGMFLLATYQVKYLCGLPSSQDVRDGLNSLTPEIDDFYRISFERIEKSHKTRDLIKRAISFIHEAKRPLNENELSDALSIRDGDADVNRKRIPQRDILRRESIGLIDFGENGNVKLAHLTVDEFLVRYPEKLISQPKLDFAKTCLTYLNLDGFAGGPCNDNETLEKRLIVYPFYQYAARHLGHHLQEIENYAERLPLVYELLADRNKISSLAQVIYLPSIRTSQWYKKFPDDTTSQHIAAYYGLHELLNSLSRNNSVKCPKDSNDEIPLHVAVQHGHSEFARTLLESVYKDKSEPYHRVDKGIILCKAASKGHLPTLEVLLASKVSKGLDITAKEKVIRSAIRGGHSHALSRLLSVFGGLEMLTGPYVRSCVGQYGDLEIVQMLLKGCEGMENENAIKSSTLFYALNFENGTTARALLEAGTKIPHQKPYLNQATWSNDSFSELLLENGANPNEKGTNDETPLHWTVQNGQVYATELLLEKGAKPDSASIHGTTPLHCAALMGYECIVNVLLEKGAKPDYEDNDGWTPLHAAALKNHNCIVEILKKETKSSNEILDFIGNLQKQTDSPQQLIAVSKEIEILGPDCMKEMLGAIDCSETNERLELLLEAGADIHAENIYGITRLIEAAKFWDVETLAILLERGAKIDKCSIIGQTALHALCSRMSFEKKEMVEFLLRKGADHSLQFLGRTPLLIAAEYEKVGSINALVKEGANVNVTDYHGRRPLHWLTYMSYRSSKEALDTLHLLIDKKADVNASDYWGRTPLMLAIAHNERPAVDLLITEGAEINAISRDGCTALHFAIFSRKRGSAYRLLETGNCDVNKEAKGSFRPLDIAILSGQLEMIRLLQEHGAEISAESHRCTISIEYEEDYSKWYKGLSRNLFDDSLRSINNIINYLSQLLLKRKNGDTETPPIELASARHYLACNLESLYEESDLNQEWTVQELAALSGSKEVQEFVEEAFAAESWNLSSTI